MLLGIEAIS